MSKAMAANSVPRFGKFSLPTRILRSLVNSVVFLAGLQLLLAAVPTLSEYLSTTQRRPRPNVVLFILDDVGYGDVGCFGNDTIRTPNIDALTAQGARLTQHISAPTCTPSRAGLMTGRLPIRYGMASTINGGVFVSVTARGGLPSTEITVAELLKDAGYATALIGKWHLGISCAGKNSCSDPNSQGFDYFYGLPTTNLRDCGKKNTVFQAWAKANKSKQKVMVSLACAAVLLILLTRFSVISWKSAVVFVIVVAVVLALRVGGGLQHNCILIENGRLVEQPLSYDHLTERLHSQAIRFVEANKNRPFLLVMSFVQAHTALFSGPGFLGRSAHGLYGDVLEEMDWSVGEILTSINNLGLDNDTLVYLTSDNGGHVEEFTDDGVREGGWNGILKGGKASTWDGGIRVPAIVKYPKIISPGTIVSQPTQLLDVLPTVAQLTGSHLPNDRIYDGRDMTPLLTSNGSGLGSDIVLHPFVFHYCGDYLNAVRYTPSRGGITYKLHFASSHLTPDFHGNMGCFDVFICQCSGASVDTHDPPLVYDLTNDPSESNPLSSEDPNVVAIVEKVRAAVETHKNTTNSQGDVENQFSWLNRISRPWQKLTCGSFPSYTCSDPYLNV